MGTTHSNYLFEGTYPILPDPNPYLHQNVERIRNRMEIRKTQRRMKLFGTTDNTQNTNTECESVGSTYVGHANKKASMDSISRTMMTEIAQLCIHNDLKNVLIYVMHCTIGNPPKYGAVHRFKSFTKMDSKKKYKSAMRYVKIVIASHMFSAVLASGECCIGSIVVQDFVDFVPEYIDSITQKMKPNQEDILSYVKNCRTWSHILWLLIAGASAELGSSKKLFQEYMGNPLFSQRILQVLIEYDTHFTEGAVQLFKRKYTDRIVLDDRNRQQHIQKCDTCTLFIILRWAEFNDACKHIEKPIQKDSRGYIQKRSKESPFTFSVKSALHMQHRLFLPKDIIGNLEKTSKEKMLKSRTSLCNYETPTNSSLLSMSNEMSADRIMEALKMGVKDKPTKTVLFTCDAGPTVSTPKNPSVVISRKGKIRRRHK